MRLLIFVFVLLQFPVAFAKCNVFVPEYVFHHSLSGREISFGFSDFLKERKYVEVESASESDMELQIAGFEHTGRFHRALAVMELGNYRASESAVCLGQACDFNDFVKVFLKAYQKLVDITPHCREK